jgi:hypothetical protein
MTQGEYATLIFYWAYEPHPERADEMLAFLAASGLADSPESVLRVAGAIDALEELQPARCLIWRVDYPDLYRKIQAALQMPLEFHGWADFLVVQWMILRRDDLIRQLLERAGAWGERDKYTAALISSTAEKHGPFRFACERLKIPVLIECPTV